MTNTSRVVVTGTWNRPELRVYFNPHQEHLSAPDKTLTVWMEEYMLGSQRGQGYWTGKYGCWTLFATGQDPERKFSLAGFEIDYSETPGTTLESVMNLDELVTPITRLTPDGKSALVLSRLYGYEATKDALGFGARWDREFKRFVMPVADAMHKGSPRSNIAWEPNILEAARLSLGRIITNEEIAGAVASAGAAKDVLEMDATDVAKLIETVGDVPDWFGLDLFPFQRIGSIAVAAGHFGLFDEPGLGKTRQTIAAAAILGSERTLITCLPVGLTGWKNEVTESLLHTLGGKNPDGEVVVIRAGKKEPKTLPDKGVIITSDSLLTSRPDLLARILEWQPDVFGYDEAHRGKTFESARSRAMLQISAATKKAPIPITGTPLFANPSELAPLLEFSGHLGPVFGGLNAYLDRYCKPAHFGGWNVRKENLPELRAKLSAHVWVRRRKRDVLPDLPKTLLVPKYVDVPLTEYKRAHKDVIVKLSKWVTDFRTMNDGADPDEETIRDFASSQVGLVSLLRRAAGVAKVPALVADIQAHVADTTEIINGQRVFTRPLIVWAHHRDVTDALAEALPSAVAETGIIRGGVAHTERDRLVSEFQAHRIPVLICSIAAAGVAITLTASSDSFFAESDWTPATVRQALDRSERIGQTSDKLISTTYLAEGTLDFRIQKILKEKSKVLDAIYGDGNDVSVDGERSDVESSTDLLVNALQMILRGEADVL